MPTPKNNPPGFYSYKHLEGADRVYLNNLRVNLEHDLLTVTGLSIKVWQDVDEIKWGQEWRKAISKGLVEAAFFIPVITPGYLYSDICRAEFEKFADYEKKRKRTDLILPLIYVRPDDFDDEHAKTDDSIIRLCLERQYVNWEDLRGLGDEGPEYRTRLTTLSKRIRELLKSLAGPTPTSTAPIKGRRRKKLTAVNRRLTSRQKVNSAAQAIDPSRLAPSEAMKNDIAPPVQQTLYVNRLGHQGTFQTIAKALEVAHGGDRIVLAPGHYTEAIAFTKAVVIAGEGNLGEVTLSVMDAHVVHSITPFGRLQNLVLHQNGGARFCAVLVEAGSLEIDGCEVTSASISCIGIHKGGEARIRHCRVHGSPHSGVAFFAGAKGVVEECDIYDNGLAGIALVGSGAVAIRSNQIHHGRTSGMTISDEARGLVEDNEIFANGLSGVAIMRGADPTVRRNRIYDGKQGGVLAISCKGAIVENKIFGNSFSGVEVRDGGGPSISDNDVYENKQSGFFVQENGAGVIENNRVQRNKFNGVTVKGGAKPQVRKNSFIDNEGFGILVAADGGGVFEGNELKSNKAGDKSLDPAAAANVQWKD